MTRIAAAILVAVVVAGTVVVMALTGLAPWSSSSASQPVRQVVVFDAVGRASFVDAPPSGPSPGDTENITARLRDAGGRFVGTAHTTCIFTKVIPNDVLENCSASGTTRDGTLTTSGVGHLQSTNPPWQVNGGTGTYQGVHGTLDFEKDLPVDPNVPLAAGRIFSVVKFDLDGHHLTVGVVPRSPTNAAFIRRATAACSAAEANAAKLPQFPFSTFDPFHPDENLLPQVGRYFDQPSIRRLSNELLVELESLGLPPTGSSAWRKVLTARRAVLETEAAQIKAALAGNAPAFVRTVYQQAGANNQLVFASAVFGVQSCTFA
jgi:hypothetical protein